MIADSTPYVESKARELAAHAGPKATREQIVVAMSEGIPVIASQRDAVIARAVVISAQAPTPAPATQPAANGRQSFHLPSAIRAKIRTYLCERRSSDPALKAEAARREVEQKFGVELGEKNFHVTYWNKSKPARPNSRPAPIPLVESPDPIAEEHLVDEEIPEVDDAAEFLAADFDTSGNVRLRLDITLPIHIGARIIGAIGDVLGETRA